jgi:hypothetical protein
LNFKKLKRVENEDKRRHVIMNQDFAFLTSPHQGCQMVYFQTKNTNMSTLYIFPFWYAWTKEKSGNPVPHYAITVTSDKPI